MFFKNIPESHNVNDNSKFVYSEDDEHLKFINLATMKRGLKYITNKYGEMTPEESHVGSNLYEKLNYDYRTSYRREDCGFSENFTYGHQLWHNYLVDKYGSSSVDDYYEYKEYDNYINYRLCWHGYNHTKTWDDVYFSEIVSYEDPVSGETRYRPYWNLPLINAIYCGYNEYIEVPQPGGPSIKEYFFPLDYNYELSFDIRVHNVEQVTYKQFVHSVDPETGRIVDYYPAHFMNGIMFTSISPYAIASDEYGANGTYPGPIDQMGVHMDYPGAEYIYYPWWNNLEDWKFVDLGSFLPFTEEEVVAHDKEIASDYASPIRRFYHRYFMRFGNDEDVHHVTFNVTEATIASFDIDKYRDKGYEPILKYFLNGLKPTSEYDSYIDIRNLTLKAKPKIYSDDSKEFTDMDHIYYNKNGIWLPDNFSKERDHYMLEQIRTTGRVLGYFVTDIGELGLFSKPIVTEAHINPVYDHGIIVAKLGINGIFTNIYYPFKTITNAYVYWYLPGQSYKEQTYVIDNNIIKYKSLAKSGLILENGLIKANFNQIDDSYDFGIVNLNGIYTHSFNLPNDYYGNWLFDIFVDITTNQAYTADDINECLILSVSGNSVNFFGNNTIVETRKSMNLFNGQTINHYKIKLTYMSNVPSSYAYVNVTFTGKLKNNAVLQTSNGLKMFIKATCYSIY